MDSADAATALGAWAWIRGYFTPATLFLVVNLVIGTIALTSRAATQQRRRREQHYYHHDGHHLQEEPMHPQMEQQPGYGQHYYHHPAEQQTLYAAAAPPVAPLARTSSVLDRLRSLGLYRFRSGDFPPEYGAAAAAAAANHAQDAFAPVEEEETTATAHYARSRSEPAPGADAGREDERRPAPAPPRVKKSGSEVRKSQVARAVPSRVVEAAVAEDGDSVEPVGGFRRRPSPLQQEYHYQEEYASPTPARAAAPAPLQRTSSVLDRLRSLGLYGFLAPDQPAASVPARDGFGTQPADDKRHAHAHYDRSRSEPAPEQQGKKEKKNPEAKSRMAKSSSEARKTRPAPWPPAVEAGGECVDARAEAFIDSFRQQQQHYREEEEEYVPPPAPAPPLSRTSSVLDRLRSFSLYRFRSGDLGPDVPETDDKDDEKHQEAAHYGRSRSEPAKKKKEESRTIKSSSSSGAVEEEEETEPCVDARADDFINRFRQQLQLQRLNSLLNYKEMLNRGGGGGKQ